MPASSTCSSALRLLAAPVGKLIRSQRESKNPKEWHPRLFRLRQKCFGEFLYGMHGAHPWQCRSITLVGADRTAFDDAPEENRAFYLKLSDHGGFRFWLENTKACSTTPGEQGGM